MKSLALATGFCAALALPALAQAQQLAPPRIVVSGEGEATVKPDLVLISLAVMREAPTAGAALDANSKAMADVIAAIKTLGVEGRDLQTDSVQINPRYDYTQLPDGSQEGKLSAYQVTNTLSVRLRDVAKVGSVIDKAVEMGVNQGGGISFANENPKPTLDEARRKAVADAMEKARVLAGAAGVNLGRVVEISDMVPAMPPVPMRAKMAFEAAPASPTPVEPGENSYQVQVNMTFELR